MCRDRRRVARVHKRLQGLVVGVVVGAVASGGAAYAAYNVQEVSPGVSDRYFACVRSSGSIRYATIKLNTRPSGCPASSDTIRSWDATSTKPASSPWFAATFRLTPEGCGPGAYRVEVVRHWGAPFTLSPSRNPVYPPCAVPPEVGRYTLWVMQVDGLAPVGYRQAACRTFSESPTPYVHFADWHLSIDGLSDDANTLTYAIDLGGGEVTSTLEDAVQESPVVMCERFNSPGDVLGPPG